MEGEGFRLQADGFMYCSLMRGAFIHKLALVSRDTPSQSGILPLVWYLVQVF